MSTTTPAPEMMQVTFWGTRGSISTPGRTTEKYGGNTPCVSVRCGRHLIILDAGTGIRNLGLDLLEEVQKGAIDMPIHLFLSHTHWDHIQGLPFFMPAYQSGVQLAIYGSPRKGAFLESVLRGQMNSDYFPVDMSAFRATLSIFEMPEQAVKIGPLLIDWEDQVFHPGGCVRYRLQHAGRTVVYATDVELNQAYLPAVPTPEMEAYTKTFERFIAKADLLIGDGQYTEEEYPKVVGWGHTSIPLVVEVAYRARVKQLAVFHHEPQHSDKQLDEIWKTYYPRYHAANPPMNIFWAREGLTVPI